MAKDDAKKDDEFGPPLPDANLFQWTTVNQQLTGTVLELKKSSTYKDGWLAKVRQDDGKVVIMGCPVKLQQAILDHRLVGKRCRITMVEVEKRERGKTLKHFTVQVAQGEQADDDHDDEEDGPF